MTDWFDGMADTFASVFGADVDVYPGGAGLPTTVSGLLRGTPVEGGEELGSGPVRALEYTLKLKPTDAVGLVFDDRVEGTIHGTALTFKVTSRIPGGSVAADGFMLFDLKLET